jgi:ketosteroid isomerase-like protein
MNPASNNPDTPGVITRCTTAPGPALTQGDVRPCVPPDVQAWLDDFAGAVRAADYRAGRRLFAEDVLGFGTVGVVLDGIDALVERQWKRVWGVTSGFRFHADRLACGVDGGRAWVGAAWTSQGRRPDGSPVDRHGRATYVLERRDGRWVAVHSHHSLDPAPGG